MCTYIQRSTVLRAFRLVSAAVALTACASASSFTSVWKNPDAEPVSLTDRKVLAIVQIRDEARRRHGEDRLAADITTRHEASGVLRR
jgi:hypothetical protein